MAVILGVLGGLYGTYCVTFCCSVGYTLIKEHQEKKKKIKLEIKKQYQQALIDERMKLEQIHCDIHRKSTQNVKLYTIVEEYEEHEEINCNKEELKKNDDFYFSEDELESRIENEGLLGYYYQNNLITEKKELS